MDYLKLNGQLHKIQQSSLFSGLAEAELDALLRLAHMRQMRAQQVIGWQGDACGEFYYLIDGHVTLHCQAASGKKHTVKIVYPGEVFALEAVFSGGGYTATMEVVSDSKILAFPASRFLSFMKNHPVFYHKVLSELSRDVTRLVCEVERHKVCSARQRLIAFLLERFDAESEDAVVEVPLLRSDLASMLGITPETLCREMKKLKQDGLVSGVNGIVHINDFSGLQSMLGETAH